jgi:hypothetical protein
VTNQLSHADITFLGLYLSEGSYYQPHKHEYAVVKKLEVHGLAEAGDVSCCYRRTAAGSAFLAALAGEAKK